MDSNLFPDADGYDPDFGYVGTQGGGTTTDLLGFLSAGSSIAGNFLNKKKQKAVAAPKAAPMNPLLIGLGVVIVLVLFVGIAFRGK